MKKYLQFILWLALFHSCNTPPSPGSDIKRITGDTTQFFVKPTGYSFTDTTRLLYTERRDALVIQLECSTNLPKGTVIIIDKSEDFESTTRMTFQDIDTVKVSTGSFTTLISPSMSTGYISFRVKERLQPKNTLEQLKASVKQESTGEYKCDELFCSFYRFRQVSNEIGGMEPSVFYIRFPVK